MRNSSIGRALAMAVLGSLGMGALQVSAQDLSRALPATPKRSSRGRSLDALFPSFYAKSRTSTRTVAQDKREARKRRNRKANARKRR
ncbi:hypothetical protein D3C87_559170 [compost metagenome]